MAWFQLDPESITDRVRASSSALALPSLSASVVRGIVGFTLVSIAGFAPWALFGRWFYRNIGEIGLYGVCAVVFIALSGLLLHRLIIGPGSLSRFYKLFTLSFIAYSIAWIISWRLLRGHPGSIVGLLAGTAVMGWILTRAFDASEKLIRVIASLFLLNTLGYFIGGWAEGALAAARDFSVLGWTPKAPLRITIAMFLWGLFYGLGFGAGLGLAFHLCQTRARALISAQTPIAAPSTETTNESRS